MMTSLGSRLSQRWLLLLSGLGLAVALAGVVTLIAKPWNAGSSEPSGPRAVIVDQLKLTAPDPQFVHDARAMLERAGYTVDYVPGRQVDVEYLRRLATHHYQVILLRAHSGLRRDEAGELTGDAHLFTSEPYSKDAHVREQLDGRLKAAGYNEQAIANGKLFFAIPESFVSESMTGNFAGAAIVLMGCDVFHSPKLAQAFVQKGAGAVVGWNDLVTSEHTDKATLAWLHYYLDSHMSVQDATAAALAEVGPDPLTGSELRSYPSANSRRTDGRKLRLR
jgi:hypothetical protein